MSARSAAPLLPTDRLLDRPAPVGGRILLVEGGFLAAVSQPPQIVGEALAGGVEVEVAHLLRGVAVPEGMDDEWRREHERPSGRDRLGPVGAEPDRQLAREDVEEVGVAAVHVGVRSVAAGTEARPGGMQSVGVGEDLDPPVHRVADDLASAGR